MLLILYISISEFFISTLLWQHITSILQYIYWLISTSTSASLFTTSTFCCIYSTFIVSTLHQHFNTSVDLSARKRISIILHVIGTSIHIHQDEHIVVIHCISTSIYLLAYRHVSASAEYYPFDTRSISAHQHWHMDIPAHNCSQFVVFLFFWITLDSYISLDYP